MILAHYAHRLPAAYDVGLIRARAAERGVLWADVPELYFKGFLLRERGRYGAIANNYSSLYLWRQDEAFRDFLLTGRYRVVTDSFGRADIATRFVLDARRGEATEARFVFKHELDIPLDADLEAAFAAEVETTRQAALRAGTVVAAVGIDAQTWRFTRIVVSANAPGGAEEGTAYEILHLARPLLDSLPQA
ncbi:DUF4865 family protein [Chelatococcus asaccharovorans]|uniref:DUF4865 family protein n=1 Tax=Chelatococcus asaccharovorans TaxID=28210 RepID=UPI00224C6D3C|nr:DUF4865 family protein [Chelatococcus asaccharovorans]CAH1665765.1 conserved hypothetical protein [Chelatococcus asaccharovorans]CAH1681795.1 conserved hypothetical protein [Chelatococcus asaccharovorans]